MKTTTDRIEKQFLLHAPRSRVWQALADAQDKMFEALVSRAQAERGVPGPRDKAAIAPRAGDARPEDARGVAQAGLGECERGLVRAGAVRHVQIRRRVVHRRRAGDSQYDADPDSYDERHALLVGKAATHAGNELAQRYGLLNFLDWPQLRKCYIAAVRGSSPRGLLIASPFWWRTRKFTRSRQDR